MPGDDSNKRACELCEGTGVVTWVTEHVSQFPHAVRPGDDEAMQGECPDCGGRGSYPTG
jgi:DnaJ-class molecular chaperone